MKMNERKVKSVTWYRINKNKTTDSNTWPFPNNYGESYENWILHSAVPNYEAGVPFYWVENYEEEV